MGHGRLPATAEQALETSKFNFAGKNKQMKIKEKNKIKYIQSCSQSCRLLGLGRIYYIGRPALCFKVR